MKTKLFTKVHTLESEIRSGGKSVQDVSITQIPLANPHWYLKPSF